MTDRLRILPLLESHGLQFRLTSGKEVLMKPKIVDSDTGQFIRRCREQIIDELLERMVGASEETPTEAERTHDERDS